MKKVLVLVFVMLLSGCSLFMSFDCDPPYVAEVLTSGTWQGNTITTDIGIFITDETVTGNPVAVLVHEYDGIWYIWNTGYRIWKQ